jgi:hypothetical protein
MSRSRQSIRLSVTIPDYLAVSDLGTKAYEPKKPVLLAGCHCDAYVEEFDVASAAA